ncbi:Ribosome-recycling factor [Citrus sinensis]|uniref:Ribosome-recycling factor n=1 Tax=Citrus sinensis TaxID=2711 RepID=A0ACB8MKC7_CITSI|nr:Ribosome-recycling factor [Citrus sinensis]
MATHFSSTGPMRSIFQLKSNPPKCLLFLPDSCHRRAETATCRASSVSVRQNGVVRCATIEEIEAEKSSIEKDVKARMERTIDMVRTNFNSVRTGRSNPAMLDKIEVEYYGSPVSLKSIAQINTPDSSSLLIQPYDKSRYPMLRTDLKSIEKAIVSSDLGMTPNNDGEVIRLTLPQLTSERRKELSKVVAKQAEEGKEKKLSEDNVKDLSSDLQKLTDEYMKKIDSIYKQKEKQPVTLFTGNTEE